MRLDRWKDIAKHLGVDQRTAQRWEKMYSLPVFRTGPKVWSTTEDIDKWLQSEAHDKAIRDRSKSGAPDERKGFERQTPTDRIVQRCLDAYERRHQVLTRNHYAQAVFITIGLALVGIWGKSYETIPIFGRQFNPAYLHFLISLVLLYFWFEFGFVLDDLIKYRATAWRNLTSKGNPKGVESLRDEAMLFNDAGFIDGWFMCFRTQEHAIDTNFLLGTRLLFLGMFCPLFAMNHAYIVYGLSVATGVYAASAEPALPLKLLLFSLPWIATGLIILTHVQFRFGGRHPNWMQWAIGVLAITIFLILSRLS